MGAVKGRKGLGVDPPCGKHNSPFTTPLAMTYGSMSLMEHRFPACKCECSEDLKLVAQQETPRFSHVCHSIRLSHSNRIISFISFSSFLVPRAAIMARYDFSFIETVRVAFQAAKNTTATRSVYNSFYRVGLAYVIPCRPARRHIAPAPVPHRLFNPSFSAYTCALSLYSSVTIMRPHTGVSRVMMTRKRCVL